MISETDYTELRRLAQSSERSYWDAWDAASWQQWIDATGWWSLAPSVSKADRDLIIACDPPTILALLDELEALRAAK